MSTTSRTTYVQTRYRSMSDTTFSNSEPAFGPMSYQQFALLATRTADDAVPGWRNLIRNGQNATSTLMGERRTLVVEDGACTAFYTYGDPSNPVHQWAGVEGDLNQSYVPNGGPVDMSTADNLAKMKFVKKCLSEMQALEGGVFLGELGQTLRMIKSPAQALRRGFDDYFDALKKRRKGSKNHRRKVIAETWLEYSYGWKPLVSDIEGGLEALDRFSRHPVRFKPVKATGQQATATSLDPVSVNMGTFHYVTQRQQKVEVAIRYQGVVNLQTGGNEVSYSDLGLRLDRFVPTLWELVPYSFIVDYFSNIGDIVSSWAFGESNLRWYFKSARQSSSFEHVTNTYIPIEGRSVTFKRKEPSKSTGQHVSVQRNLPTDGLVPSFRLEIPGATSLKWLNLAALAQTRRTLRPY
jgi:hypothetical protein